MGSSSDSCLSSNNNTIIQAKKISNKKTIKNIYLKLFSKNGDFFQQRLFGFNQKKNGSF